jgi:hypothetical protein
MARKHKATGLAAFICFTIVLGRYFISMIASALEQPTTHSHSNRVFRRLVNEPANWRVACRRLVSRTGDSVLASFFALLSLGSANPSWREHRN